MPGANLNLLEIFKAGTHTAKDGRVVKFTAAELDACAKAYDPALYEAPLVIGHPAESAPAYGWAKRLEQDADGKLRAEPDKVDPEFARMVNDGRFPKISSSFFLPDSPENPKPGTLYLRHVGFLGAQPPAVLGLKNASFAAAGKGIVEFTDWNAMSVAGLFRRLKNWIIDRDGQEKADAVIPEYEIESLQVNAAKKPDQAISYSQGEDVDKAELERRSAQLAADQAKLATERTEFAARQTTFNTAEAAALRARAATVCQATVDALVKEGKVLPAQAAGLAAFMAALPSDGVVEFGAGDKAVKKPSRTWLEEYLKAQPKVVDFAERGAGGADAIDTTDPVKAGLELNRRATEFQAAELKAGRHVSIDMAVKHVQKQGEHA